jgi:hypothetical protein
MSEIPSALMPSPEVQPPVDSGTPVAQAQQPTGPQYEMLQTDTKHTIAVPHDDVYTAVKSGQYLPRNADTFVIKDSNGEGRQVSGQYLKQALDSGFTLESSGELHDRTLQDQYGGASGMAQALGAGVARGGTLGISDVVGAAAGQAQNLSNLQEANPITSTIGEVAGFIGGSLLGSTEESVVARGAGALIKGTEKVAAGAGAFVEKSLIKDAAKAGVSSKIAASLAGKIAAEATTGAFIGAGNFISEAALGHADVNAENLATAVGMGAIIGGGLGLGFGVIGIAAKGVGKAASLVTDPLVGQIDHALDNKVAAAKILGVPTTSIQKLEMKSPGVVSGMTDYLTKDLGLVYTDTTEKLLTKNEAVLEASGTKIGEVLKEIDGALVNNPGLKPMAKDVFNNVYNKVFTHFEEYFSDVAGPGADKVQKPITRFLDDVHKLSLSEKAFGAEDLQKLKRMQDDLMNYNKVPGTWSPFEDAVHITRTALKQEIDGVAQTLEKHGLSSDLSAQLKNANRQYASAITFGPFLEKAALKNADKSVSFLGVAKDLALDFKRKMVVLGKIEGAGLKTQTMINKAAKGMTAVGDAASKVQAEKVIPLSILNSEFAKKYDNGKYKKPATVGEAYVNMNDNFSRYSSNPEAFTSKVNRSTSQIYNQAPQTSQALDALSVAAATFLASKLPKRNSAPGMLEVFDKPRPPSHFDLAKFEAYVGAVEHPESVFKQMNAGRLTSESVEAIQAVYPNLYTKLRDSVLAEIGKNPKMPYNKKLQLGTLLGIPTHESMMGENVLALQSFFETKPDAQGAETGTKPTQSGMAKISSSERMETDTQSDTTLT